MPRVNKWLDLLDRAGWTAVQATAGIVAAVLFGNLGWQDALKVVAVATAAAIVKVTIGQNTGTDDTGALIPGVSPIEPEVKD